MGMQVNWNGYKYHKLQTAAGVTGAGSPMRLIDDAGGGLDAIAVQVEGITSATVTWQVSLNGVDWYGILLSPPPTGTGALTATADGIYRGNVKGLKWFRANITTFGSGTIEIEAFGVA